jgi:hypothetical protein
MFPPEWADKKGPPGPCSKKRKVNQKDELKTLLSTLPPSPVPFDSSEDTLVCIIKRQVNSSRSVPAIPEELHLDHVLSSVPYQDMLESLFGGITQDAPSLPLITKAYEESYMREPCPDERPCAMGPKCECMFIDPNAPFVGVEFLSPLTSERGAPNLCVLCSRRTTQKLFYDACYSGRRVQGVIQRYGNLCNQPGEYARECMLISPPNAQWSCLPLPIMSHQRNRYRVQVVAGRKHLQQMRVSFEDFVPPSVGALG